MPQTEATLSFFIVNPYTQSVSPLTYLFYSVMHANMTSHLLTSTLEVQAFNTSVVEPCKAYQKDYPDAFRGNSCKN